MKLFLRKIKDLILILSLCFNAAYFIRPYKTKHNWFVRRYLAYNEEYETDPEEEQTHQDSLFLTAFIVLLVVILIQWIYNKFEENRTWQVFSTAIPQASCNIFVGIVFGLILSANNTLGYAFSFDSNFFFEVLLPPIIFSAGYLLRKDLFFQNFGSITTYAFMGTAFTTFFTGAVVYSFSAYTETTYTLSFEDSMVFGSLISAVDPVATMVVLERMATDENLYMIIFGEAVLNDAVAVVFFEVFKSVTPGTEISKIIPLAIGLIMATSFVSILIGVTIGFIICFIYKHANLHEHHDIELICFIIGSLMPYYIADLCGYSGIMAVLFCGFVSDSYTYYHFSDTGKISITNICKTMSVILEGFVFVYLGMALFDENSNKYDVQLVSITLFCCLFGRALSVIILTGCLNLCLTRKINFQWQVTMWLAGLRGPVAFALAFVAPNETELIVSATLIIAFITTVVLGGSTGLVLEYFAASEEDNMETVLLANFDQPVYDATGEVMYDSRGRMLLKDSYFSWFQAIDEFCVRKIFGNPEGVVDYQHHDRTYTIQFKSAETE